jgi:hypothetical protein
MSNASRSTETVSQTTLVGAVLGALLVGALFATIATWLAMRTDTPEESAPIVAATKPRAKVAAVEKPTPADEIVKIKTAAKALAYAKPHMSDPNNKLDRGTLLLSVWSFKRMRWSDVHVVQDETSFGATMKDPDGVRGLRMCWGGSIIQISVLRTPYGVGAEGILMTNSTKLIRFVAAGSSGDIVQGSPARICGFVTGKYSYSNSAGGTGHAVKMVGMFSLPENKTN